MPGSRICTGRKRFLGWMHGIACDIERHRRGGERVESDRVQGAERYGATLRPHTPRGARRRRSARVRPSPAYDEVQIRSHRPGIRRSGRSIRHTGAYRRREHPGRGQPRRAAHQFTRRPEIGARPHRPAGRPRRGRAADARRSDRAPRWTSLSCTPTRRPPIPTTVR